MPNAIYTRVEQQLASGAFFDTKITVSLTEKGCGADKVFMVDKKYII